VATGWDRVEETHLQGVPGEVGPAAETEFVTRLRARRWGLSMVLTLRHNWVPTSLLVDTPLGQECGAPPAHVNSGVLTGRSTGRNSV